MLFLILVQQFLEKTITFEDCQSLLKDYVLKSDFQYLMSNKASVEEFKTLLESKVSLSELKSELNIIHLKTDSNVLFESTEEEIKEHGYDCLELTWDLYASLEGKTELEREIFSIKTHYEELFTAKGSVIKYCKFRVG